MDDLVYDASFLYLSVDLGNHFLKATCENSHAQANIAERR